MWTRPSTLQSSSEHKCFVDLTPCLRRVWDFVAIDAHDSRSSRLRQDAQPAACESTISRLSLGRLVGFASSRHNQTPKGRGPKPLLEVQTPDRRPTPSAGEPWKGPDLR